MVWSHQAFLHCRARQWQAKRFHNGWLQELHHLLAGRVHRRLTKWCAYVLSPTLQCSVSWMLLHASWVKIRQQNLRSLHCGICVHMRGCTNMDWALTNMFLENDLSYSSPNFTIFGIWHSMCVGCVLTREQRNCAQRRVLLGSWGESARHATGVPFRNEPWKGIFASSTCPSVPSVDDCLGFRAVWPKKIARQERLWDIVSRRLVMIGVAETSVVNMEIPGIYQYSHSTRFTVVWLSRSLIQSLCSSFYNFFGMMSFPVFLSYRRVIL